MASINLSSFAGAGAQFFDNNGTPLVGGLLYVYTAGTTTPATTWTSPSGTVANTNPIVLDAGGRTPYEIWVNGGVLYKFVLKTSTGVTIGTYDSIPAIDDPTAFNNIITVTGTNTLIGTSTPANTAYARGMTLSFVVVNTNTGAVTIDVDGLGAKEITFAGSTPLVAKQLNTGSIVSIEYDGTRFQLMGSSGSNAIITSSINGGQIAGLRNRIINGDMRVVQRPSFALVLGSDVYGGADRTAIGLLNFTTASGTANCPGPFSTAASNASSSGYLQTAESVTTTGSGIVRFSQKIESLNCSDLNGKTITIQCILLQDTGASLNAVVSVYKPVGFNNWSSSTLIASSGNFAVSGDGTTKTSVTHTLTLGSADATNGLQVIVAFNSVGAVTNKNFYMGDFQLETGSLATPIEFRTYGTEANMCYRYYQPFNWKLNGYGLATNVLQSTYTFPVPMRTTPTVVNETATNTTNCSGAAFIVNNYSSGSYRMTITATGYGVSSGNGFVSSEL